MKWAISQDLLELRGVIIQKTEFVQFLINDLHDMLGYSALLQPFSKLLLDGVLVLLFQAQLFLDNLQLLLQEVFPVRLFDLLLHLQEGLCCSMNSSMQSRWIYFIVLKITNNPRVLWTGRSKNIMLDSNNFIRKYFPGPFNPSYGRHNNPIQHAVTCYINMYWIKLVIYEWFISIYQYVH